MGTNADEVTLTGGELVFPSTRAGLVHVPSVVTGGIRFEFQIGAGGRHYWVLCSDQRHEVSRQVYCRIHEILGLNQPRNGGAR